MGGAEILDDDVRAVICNGKESSDEYLQIHREAHEVGLPSNCTMLFGTIERLEQRLQHMISLRELNEETRGFQCFVPYPFLPDHTGCLKLNWQRGPKFYAPSPYRG